MGRRLPPQAHARPLHDAHPHAQRDRDGGSGPPARRDHPEAGRASGRTDRRRHHAPASTAALGDHREGPEVIARLEAAGLSSLQTGMDNIRGIVGCPATGLTPRRAARHRRRSPRRSSAIFLGNKAFTNLPRKFNVTITGCLEHCTGGETQDISMTPASLVPATLPDSTWPWAASRARAGPCWPGPSTPSSVPRRRREVCAAIALAFRDHGPRESRSQARLAFLIEERGVAAVPRGAERAALARRCRRPDATRAAPATNDHVGIFRQKQPGLNYVGLKTAVGRVTGQPAPRACASVRALRPRRAALHAAAERAAASRAGRAAG